MKEGKNTFVINTFKKIEKGRDINEK